MRDRVLLIESDPECHKTLFDRLTDAGYFVISTTSTEKALDKLWKAHPDLIVLAAHMTGMTAIQFSVFVRGDPRIKAIPILLVSEPMNTPELVTYFRSGVDDQITYSTPKDEFAARVRALLRRSYSGEETQQVYEFSGIVLRAEERRVIVDGAPVKLTRKEFELLRTLMSRPEKVVPVSSLLSGVWGYDKDVSTNTLQVHINRLRNKLGAAGSKIKNHPGVGYAFAP